MNFNNPNLIFKEVPTGKIGWSSPSNIALVKYWGKKGHQIPANPSLSFTLNKSVTDTIIEYSPSVNEKCNISFFLDGIPNQKFAEKITVYFNSIIEIFPFLKQLDFNIYSKNTFPHSAGIASSASGMSAIALALCDIENQYFHSFASSDEFFNKASFVARLGSGSACRSVYGGVVSWGKIDGYDNASDYFGSKLNEEIHPVFKNYHDSVLIVDSNQKKVSSTIGHGLMHNNPFSEARFKQAASNVNDIIAALKQGDQDSFVNIVESEALTLHAMMMTSSPYFLLLKPNTISIIEEIWKFRQDTNTPLCFTIDAGPNIHLLYPHSSKEIVQSFIKTNILKFTDGNTVINDYLGNGPSKLA